MCYLSQWIILTQELLDEVALECKLLANAFVAQRPLSSTDVWSLD